METIELYTLHVVTDRREFYRGFLIEYIYVCMLQGKKLAQQQTSRHIQTASRAARLKNVVQ